MKHLRHSSLLLVFLAFGFLARAQDQSSDSALDEHEPVELLTDTVLHLQEQKIALQEDISKAADSVRKLNASILEGNFREDSGAVALARANPEEQLYKSILTHHAPRRGLNRWAGLRMTVCTLLILIFVGTGIWLSWRNALIRDPSFDVNGELRPIHERPFSFARVQLFWWTLIIISCYTYFFGLTAVLVPINSTTVILLGCGVLVYAGGRLIDNKQIKASGGVRHQDGDATCQGFFTDILSDETGISMHRFQALAFTVVFGVAYISYFVRGVFSHTYPLVDFSEGQFALIGISSVAYLGLKATENKVTATDTTIKAAPENASDADCPPDAVVLKNKEGEAS